jgi:hypothetical protein
MAPGKVHAIRARRVAAVATMAWIGVFAWSPSNAVFGVGLPVGSWIGCIFTSDRDFHERLTEEELNAIRRWGILNNSTR